MSDPDTRTRLLDAAEQQFSEQGYAGASLRDITEQAQANLAAVSYHFGSKEDLFVAVVARRVEPINRERMRLLDQALAQSGGRPLTVECLVEAMVAPLLRAGCDGPCALRLVARSASESQVAMQRVMDGPLREIRARLSSELRRALPELDERQIAYRLHFLMCTVKGVASEQHMLRVASGGKCDADDVEATLAQLVPFLAAGMSAASPRSTPSTRRVRSRHA